MRFWTLLRSNSHFFIFASSLFFIQSVSFAYNPAGKYVFVENKGQWPEEVLFKADIPGGYLLVKQQGLQYFFYDTKTLAGLHAGPKKEENTRKEVERIKTQNVFIEFEGSQRPISNPLEEQAQLFNYFYGKNSTKWVQGARGFKEIWLKGIYTNIDFRLYSMGEALKYEYVVHPGAKVSDISMAYSGHSSLQIENGALKLATEVNNLKEFEPYTFQKSENSRRSVKSSFHLENDVVSFRVSDYNQNEDLIIDPELIFSTYSGSASDNWSHTATYDSQGNLYAGGTVFGPSFPVTQNAAQNSVGGATNSSGFLLTTDVVIMKYSSDGQTLLYSTFLGGTHSEVPHSMICNSQDQLVVFGTTSSPDFPVSNSAFQKNFRGGQTLNGGPITTGIGFVNGTDMFLTVLREDGSALRGSTLLGGSENDGIHDYRAFLIQNYGDEFRGEVYVGPDDDIYVASITTSDNFPVVGSNSSLSSGYDGIVFQMSPNVSQLKWSTYLGGKRYDAAYGIRVNSANEVFVVGTTLSDDLNASSNAINRTRQGEADAFVIKFVNGQQVALTYLGTAEEEIGNLIDLDTEDNVYVFGLSQGAYPINGVVYQNPGSGQFIHSLNSSLTETNFSTVIGTGKGVGMVDLVPTAFLVNDCGNIYLAGWGGKINTNNGYNPNSTTEGLPVSSDAYRTETSGNNYYLAILEAGARSLLYATYFGSQTPADPDDERGDHLDGGTCRFDKNGIIYHSACVCRGQITGNVSFPTENGLQANHNSNNCNMAAFKFDIDVLEANFDLVDGSSINPDSVCQGSKLKLENKSKGGITYQWSVNGEVISRLREPEYLFEEAGNFEIKLETFNVVTCAKSDSFFRSIHIIPFESSVMADTSVCGGSEVILNAEGGDFYTWSPSNLLDDSEIQNPTALVSESTTFTVLISNDLCSVEREVTLLVEDTKEDFIVTESSEICSGDEVILKATGLADYFVWSSSDISELESDSLTVQPFISSTYTVQAFYADGCKPKKEVSLLVDDSYAPDFDYSIEYDCGKPFELKFENLSSGSALYTWKMGNGDSLSSQIPENYTYAAPGIYEVTVDAQNPIGCVLSITKPVEIPEDDGLIPNAISPNNDGKNDTFIIGMSNVHLKIFNRWGKTVFESEDYQNDWGTDVAIGTYYYEIQIPNGRNCKGWIEVFP
ncbi:hypothetical protein AFM12_02680 [Jiulongibacter sediminis]|uniref:PKD domain-containing protein n=1 Tax=Jiulongibacter sediminis TaxID=1605367 RepID=A0A0P7BFA0_9BACT|nr:hypothetical protein AFM12_02680 [Jiulongibacter sediminis]